VLWREEGIENTVTVTENPERRVLFLNSHHQANDSAEMVRYHRLIGHLPMVLHPDPRRALVIGLGGGATPGAVAQHPDVAAVCVELSPSVIGGARYFAHVNEDALSQPNLEMRVDDGRNHLLLTRDRYDVITADVILPHHAGAGNLYSVEYYRLCYNALAPGGLMCQWVSQSSRTEYRLMLRTFLRAFPHVTLWTGGTLLIGSNQPITLSRAAIAARFRDARARASLAAVGLHDVEDVLQQYTGNRDEIAAYAGDGRMISDDWPLIEFYRALGTGGEEAAETPLILRDIARAFRSRPPVARVAQ
jgi:spermidine synthase